MEEHSRNMMKPCFSFLGFFVVILAILTALMWLLGGGDVRMAQAEALYHRGESALTVFEKNRAFNQALDLFLKLEEKHAPNFGTGKLPYNIGNTYFQLGVYPLAIFYYKSAENLMPRSGSVKKNLSLTRQKMGLETPKTTFFDFVFLRNFLSLAERLQLFFVSSLLTLLLFSIWLWKKNRWLVLAGSFFCAVASFLLINLGFSYYLSPIEAVLIHAVEVRRDAGMGFAKAADRPIPGGSVLEVTGSTPDGKWLKVFAADCAFGYVPSESLRIID